MKDILQLINSVDGVIGSAVFNQKGNILAQVFPPLFDAASLKKSATLTLECTHGLQISETLDMLDLRYADGRLLVKTFPGAMLFLMCANSINLQVLSITLNLTVKRLEAKLPKEPQEVSLVVPQSESLAPQNSDGLLRMSISHLANKQASASFDSLGMIALSQPTSQYISDIFKSPFKKLTLTNVIAGASGTFPVMVVKDMDRQYDGTVVVGPGIGKKLKVNEGDKVEVRVG
jgi:predicted regulator of Ras-like GTPase activity (Roadblock/LC7/MglB family)